jgi:copper chaperone
MDTLTLHVTGMTCGGCENAVKRALTRLDGVTEVTASHAAQQVVVTYDGGRVTPDQIKSKVSAVGYTVVG